MGEGNIERGVGGERIDPQTAWKNDLLLQVPDNIPDDEVDRLARLHGIDPDRDEVIDAENEYRRLRAERTMGLRHGTSLAEAKRIHDEQNRSRLGGVNPVDNVGDTSIALARREGAQVIRRGLY